MHTGETAGTGAEGVIAVVEKLDERGAVQRITEVLSKSARGRRLAEGTETPEATKAA